MICFRCFQIRIEWNLMVIGTRTCPLMVQVLVFFAVFEQFQFLAKYIQPSEEGGNKLVYNL